MINEEIAQVFRDNVAFVGIQGRRPVSRARIAYQQTNGGEYADLRL